MEVVDAQDIEDREELATEELGIPNDPEARHMRAMILGCLAALRGRGVPRENLKVYLDIALESACYLAQMQGDDEGGEKN